MTNKLGKIGKISVIHREIRRKISEVGIFGTIKLGVGKLFQMLREINSLKKQDVHPFDLKYGTDTSGIIKPGALDIPEGMVKHAVQYQTAIVEVFLDILKSLTISFNNFFFIDLGSGKGRALLLASQYPFKEIIGVELSPYLHGVACRNIAIYQDDLQQCGNIHSVCEDVMNYKIPHEKIVFYLFNPFDKHVMSELFLKIENSFNKYPRDMYIAYLKPMHRDIFDKAYFLEIDKETERYIIYKSKSAYLLTR